MALVVVAAGMMLSVINVTIVNITLPTVAADFGVDISAVGWVVTGFLVTQATLLLLAGRAGDLYGRRRVFVVGIWVVIVTSALCAIAWNAPSLIAFRVLQGIGACAMAPTAIGYVAEIFPERERGQAMGVLAGVIGVAPVIALNLAGLLVGAFGWRSVFWFSPLLGVVVLAGALLVLVETTPHGRGEPFDVAGAALVAVGLFSTLLAISRGEVWGWTSLLTLASAVVGALGLVGFVVRERRTPYPMLHLGMFRQRSLSSASAASFLSASALFGALVLLPFYLTAVLGYGPQRLGLAITPVAASFVLVAPWAGRLVPRYGPAVIARAGFVLGAVGAAIMAAMLPGQRYAAILPGLVIFACGLAMAIAPINTTAIHDVPAKRLGSASSLPNIFRYTGGAIGSAIMLAIVHGNVPDQVTRSTHRVSQPLRDVISDGVAAAMLVAVAALVLSFIVSFAMPSRLAPTQ